MLDVATKEEIEWMLKKGRHHEMRARAIRETLTKISKEKSVHIDLQNWRLIKD